MGYHSADRWWVFPLKCFGGRPQPPLVSIPWRFRLTLLLIPVILVESRCCSPSGHGSCSSLICSPREVQSLPLIFARFFVRADAVDFRFVLFDCQLDLDFSDCVWIVADESRYYY
jgi:hypothetical protein